MTTTTPHYTCAISLRDHATILAGLRCLERQANPPFCLFLDDHGPVMLQHGGLLDALIVRLKDAWHAEEDPA